MFKVVKKVIGLFHHKVENRFFRYLFVGGLNTVFGYSVYCLLIWFGLSFVWATLISHVMGVLFNFMTTGILVFENHDVRKLFKFVMNYVLTYFINIGINKTLQVTMGSNEYVAGAGATLLTALISFFILKRFVYNENVHQHHENH